MKIASLLIPAYLPRAHPGATPTPYQSGQVDKFKRELAGLSNYILEHANAKRLFPDPAGRFVTEQIVTRYDIEGDDAAIGAAVCLAMRVFGVTIVATILDGEVIDMNGAQAEAMAEEF